LATAEVAQEYFGCGLIVGALMRKIIISYRRADSDAIAGRIRDRLANHFGDSSIFMDIDSIPFGTDFRDCIRDPLLDSDILIAIVGPKWLGHRRSPRRGPLRSPGPARFRPRSRIGSFSSLMRAGAPLCLD
jgi:hypothetical protein